MSATVPCRCGPPTAGGACSRGCHRDGGAAHMFYRAAVPMPVGSSTAVRQRKPITAGPPSARHSLLQPRRRRARCPPAPAASSSAAAAAEAVVADLPNSREQSIRQAAEALAAQLPKEKKGKGNKVGSIKRIAIDVPDADQSPAAAVQLARDLLASLPRASTGAFTVVFGDAAAAEAAAAGGLSQPVAKVDPERREPLAGPLLVVGATQEQVADVREMLYNWRGGVVAGLNLEWDPDSIGDSDLASFARSFEHVYCFGPLEIQGFFSKREGCVFKWVKRGSPAAAPWFILSREGDAAWQVVGRQARRPLPGDLEAAFYNAAAASSPLTKGVKFFKDLTSGGGRKGK